MINLYLKTDDQETMYETLVAANLLDIVDDQYIPVYGMNLDVIGQITNINPITEVVTSIPGWHFNLRLTSLTDQQEEILEPYVIPTPNTPFRVWF
jgi:hypothetical protein